MAHSEQQDDPLDPTADAGAAALAQQELLESSLELVFAAYDDAVAEAMVEPVVFLLDCEDAIGEQIANAWLGAENVRNAVTEQQLAEPGGELTTVFAQAFPMAESRREVPAVFAYLAPIFDTELPADGFLAIAVTAGGASAFTVPLSAREQSS